MSKAKKGDHVTVSYETMLENGEVVESSRESGPFEYEIGSGIMPPGLDNGLIGMQEGEEKTISLQPEEAYGPRDENLFHTVRKSVFGEKIAPKVGMVLGMTVDRDGEKKKIPALVTAVDSEDVTIDFNHPLAGKTIIYKITLEKIR